MANFGVTGGIGAGIMQGLQFMRQREGDARQEQALANQTELLSMQKQIHGEKMGQINRANAEVQRAETLDTLKGSIEANYQDRPDYERAEMFRKYGAEMGQFKPADLDAATKVRDGLLQVAGPEAYQSLLRGNIDPMRKLLGARGYDLQSDPKGGKFLIKMPGADAAEAIDKEGLLQLDAMATYRDRLAAKAKADLDARKTLADIRLKEADANLKDRLPQERVAGSGAGSGKGGKDPKAYDPIGTLEDFNKAIGNDPQTSQPYAWAPTALQHYQQIIDANPSLAGTKQGGQYALNLAMALGRGDAKAVPEIDANGNTKLIATWPGAGGQSPRKAVLQDNIDMSDPSMVQGVGGNQIVQPAEWVKVQTNAIQNYARMRPDEYKLVAPIAADDAKLARLAAAAESDPNAARQYRFAKLIRGQIDQQATAPASQPGKKPMTQDDAKVAAALNIDPEDPGLMGRIGAITNRFTTAMSGIAKRSSEANVESQLRALQRNPGDRATREWLFARSVGNPELQAKIMATLNKTAE